MYAVEITGAIDASGTLETFYLSTDGFTTSGTDTPARTNFIDKLLDAGSVGIHAFSDGATGGATKLEVGNVKVANTDGEYDVWRTYSFDGRPIIIRKGNVGDAYPSEFTTIFSGTIDDIEMDWTTVTLRLRDKQYMLNKPVLTIKYAGTNSLPNGVEGTSNDVGGKNKPRTIGKVYNVAPPQNNTSKLLFQVSNGSVNDISSVYDGGLGLTKGANYANSTLLLAAIPAASSYITCFAEGMFRLGSTPAQQITADVVQGASSADRTVGQILKRLALDAGLSSGEISSSDVTALDALNSSEVGVYTDDDSTFVKVMDAVANSIGVWYGFDRDGVLRMGQLTLPIGTPSVTLYDYEVLDGIERRVADNSLPTWSVKVNHTKIYSVQTSGLSGAVTAAQRAYLSEEYRTIVSESASVKTQYMLALTKQVDTLLTSSSDATTEAARQLGLYEARKDFFDVPVDLTTFFSHSLKCLDLIAVQLSRFGMESGRNFRLLGYNIQTQDDVVVLSVWG